MNKAFRYRLYPTQEQQKILASHFGQARFVYNYFLRQRIDFYAAHKGEKKQSLSYYDTAKMLTDLKNQPETFWLQESNAQSLQRSLRHLDAAYSHFFKHKFQFPKFKKKHHKQSFSVPQNFKIDTKQSLLYLPKLTPLKFVMHRPFNGLVKSVTISKTSSGKYFVSVLCEIETTVKPKKNGSKIGLDLGLKSFVVTSGDERIEAPQFYRRSEHRLKLLQRRVSRKVKGSNNRNQARIKVARLHEHIANQRKDFLHKLSHQLVSENQALYVEDLNVKGMNQNHRLAKSIHDASWSEFIRQLKYKSEWTGTHFEQIDRFFPSSKRCVHCGWINENLTLRDREWTCQACGKTIDRDINAAQNILQFANNTNNIIVGWDAPKLQRPGRCGALRPVVELGSSRC